MRLSHGCWVLVMDGAKALFLRNHGDEDILNLEVRRVLQQGTPPNRDLVRDRPGRFPIPRGGVATSVAKDAHTRLENRFAIKVVEQVLDMVLNDSHRDLLLVADPKTLGMIRPYLVKVPGLNICAELNKDLTRHDLRCIETLIRMA